MIRAISILIVLMSCSAAKAEDGNFYLMAELGRGAVEFTDDYLIEEFDGDEDFSSTNVVAGYNLDSNVLFTVNFNPAKGDKFSSLDDRYEFYQLGIAVGYKIELSDRFSLTPSLGYARWEVDAREGQFLNPGPEESVEKQGGDVFGRLEVGFRLNGLLGFNWSYVTADYDFGKIQSHHFGVKFTIF
ncbi:MAG: porin family protein [Agarilytica sp.]